MPRTLDDGTEVYTADEIQDQIAEANAGLEANRKKALDQLKATKRELEQMRDSWDGLDPDQVRDIVAKHQEADRKKLKEEGDWEAREKQLTEAHGKAMRDAEARMEKLQSTVRKSLVSAKLTAAIVAQKGDPDLLLPHAEKFVDVREADDGYEAFVVDEQGHPRVADGQGTPMTFDQLVTEQLIPKYPRAFDGTGSSGSGASKSAAGGGGPNSIAADDDSAFIHNVDKIATGEVVVR